MQSGGGGESSRIDCADCSGNGGILPLIGLLAPPVAVSTYCK
jgi:hypothetical protein